LGAGDSLRGLVVTSARTGTLQPGTRYFSNQPARTVWQQSFVMFRNSRCFIHGILILSLLSFPTFSEAQLPDKPLSKKRSLTLADAKQIAFERNWDLLAAKAGIDAATAQLIATKEYPNPTLSFSVSKIGTHDSATTLGNGVWQRSYDTVAAVSQLVEIGGKRGNRQASAKAGVLTSRARFYDAKRSLEQGVTKAYVAALLAEENQRTLAESSRSLRHEADIAAARFKAGDISDADRRQIENNADTFELQARAAETAAIQARIAVEILLGVDQPAGNWTPTDSLEKLATSAPIAPQNTANGARPDVLAAETGLKGSEADLKLQKAIRIPDPTFSLLGEHEPPGGGPAVNTFGIGISFPLPLWNRNRGGIQSAQATVSQNEIALAKVKAQVAMDIADAEIAYNEASARLHHYQADIRPNAAKVRETIAFAYEKGGASLVDLLTAERDDNSIRLATSQAMADTANAAADLAAARNVLSKSELTALK
jgi:outer membrane protein, heavy metal efflux system